MLRRGARVRAWRDFAACPFRAMRMDNLLRVFALASVAPLSAAETAALYGAAAPATLLPRYRRGWDYCTANLCGGAERLGALLDVGDLRELGPEGADKIHEAAVAYGVVVIKGQNLTRAEQVKFTGPVSYTHLTLPTKRIV